MGYKPCISKYMHLITRLEEFMERRYELRYNEITDEAEYRENHSLAFRFKPVTIKVMHDMCMNAQKEGIGVLDPDIKRYIISNRLPTYNPLLDFINELPVWDEKDRIRALAGQVPTDTPVGGNIFISGLSVWLPTGLNATGCIVTVWFLYW
ncbi:MAG: hypothetical protein LIP01_12625 [Tannerellaceae bacterium]|nr:hypothetical protein [Tannerellaceae bacterium]